MNDKWENAAAKFNIPKKIINKWILKIDYSKWENGKQSGISGKIIQQKKTVNNP
ncbi:MAG: hypothetical protein KDK36_08545 [Leptospiraceae bacterium]|nr:hypothetical protein [Leptospiraceae bacterium]